MRYVVAVALGLLLGSVAFWIIRKEEEESGAPPADVEPHPRLKK